MIAALIALLAVVNSPVNSVTYACDGVTAAYTVNFPYLASGDLVVTTTTAAGVVTALVPGTDFTVSVTSTSSTALLTVNAPAFKCPAGNTFKIARILSITQPTSFKQQNNYSPSVHEQAYDRATMIAQQNALAAMSSADITGNLPAPVLTATGVAAGTYGSGTNVPVITLDTKGRATNATMTPVFVTGTTTNYTAPFAGATTQATAGKLSNIVSLIDFLPMGYVTDGSVDYTTQFQTAINDLTSGVIDIPGNATYTVSTLTMKSNVWVRFNGATLKMKANAAINAKMFDFSGAVNSGILGSAKLDGNRANQVNTGNNGQFGVLIGASAADIYLQSVYATGFSEDSLYIGIGGLNPNTTPTGISIGSFISDSAIRNGVSITNGKNIHFGYLETRLTNGAAPEAGIDFETNFATDTMTNITIDHLVTHNNNSFGIQILGVLSGTSVVQGWITIGRLDSYSNASGGGVLMYRVRNVSILSGSIHDNTGDGVYLPRDIVHLRLQADIYKNTLRGINGAQTSVTISSTDWDFSGTSARDNSQGVGNVSDGIKLDTDNAGFPLLRVTGHDVKLFDDQLVMTQRFGLSTGTNCIGADFTGYIPGNATGSYSLGAQGYAETGLRIYSSQIINYAAPIASATCNVQNLTVSGANNSDTLILSPTGMVSSMFPFGFASGVNTVTITLCNLSGAPQTPGNIRYQMTVVKH